MTNMQKFTRITGEIDSLYHEAAFRLGLSDSAMTVLYTLLNTGGQCDISEICRLSGMRKQTLNSALRKLEQDDLLCLKNSTPKNKTVFLSKKGYDAALHSAGKLQKIEEETLEEWSQDEVDTFLGLAERYMNRFRGLVELLQENGLFTEKRFRLLFRSENS